MQALNSGFPNTKRLTQVRSRDGETRRELKHLSTGRKRKQIVMPLIAASEKGRGQTESSLEREEEMW